MNLCLNDPYNGIQSDQHKVNTVMSLIRGNAVDTWVKNLYDDSYDETTGVWRLTWAGLVLFIKERFVDANAERLVQIKLENLQQAKDTVEDFFQQFEMLARKAGYTKHNPYLLTLLECNVNQAI